MKKKVGYYAHKFYVGSPVLTATAPSPYTKKVAEKATFNLIPT